jgi:hypothetical protein
MKKIFFIMIIYILISQITLLQVVNSSYKIHNPIDFHKQQLIVSTHDYEHIDIFILLDQVMNQLNHVTIVFADHLWNYILYLYIRILGYNHIHFLFITDNTVNKVLSILQRDETVIIYSYRHNESSGIYHILQQTKSPLYLCKIKSDHEYTNLETHDIFTIIYENFGTHYDLNYKSYKYDHLLDLHPHDFIKQINKKLYI